MQDAGPGRCFCGGRYVGSVRSVVNGKLYTFSQHVFYVQIWKQAHKVVLKLYNGESKTSWISLKHMFSKLCHKENTTIIILHIQVFYLTGCLLLMGIPHVSSSTEITKWTFTNWWQESTLHWKKINTKWINEQINENSEPSMHDWCGWRMGAADRKSRRHLPYNGDRTTVKRGNARAVRAWWAHDVWMQHSCTTCWDDVFAFFPVSMVFRESADGPCQCLCSRIMSATYGV